MIPFAIKNNRLVSIEEVPRGLACGCICPACQAPLMAKKGALNTHHFAHYRTAECPGALESSLHLMAKAVLTSTKKVVVPPVFILGVDHYVQNAKLLRFANVRLEQYQQGIIPDIILEAGHRKMLVEIAVHHKAEWRKIWQLQKLKLPAIEISLGDMHRYLNGLGKGACKASFTEMLVHDFQYKKWLFNPRQHSMEHQLRKAAEKKRVRARHFGNRHHYIVDRCPAIKRIRRFGPMDGTSYANVFQDCLHCSHCMEVEYSRRHVGYRIVPLKPEYVFCLGKLKKEVRDLRRWVWEKFKPL